MLGVTIGIFSLLVIAVIFDRFPNSQSNIAQQKTDFSLQLQQEILRTLDEILQAQKQTNAILRSFKGRQ